MKYRFLCLAFVVFGCASLAPLARAQAAEAAAAAAPKTAADLDYDAAWASFRSERPETIKQGSRELYLWSDRKYQEFAAAVRAFGEKYPDDPRRYEGWVQSSYTGPSYIVDFKPEFDTAPGWANIVSDPAKVLAYRAEQVRLLGLVLEAEDATTRQRGGAFNALVIDSGTVARLKGEKFDLASVRPLVDRVVAKLNDERALPVVEQYSARLRQVSPADAEAFEAGLAAHAGIAAALAETNARRVAAAAEKAKKLTALASMKFTAADGREVDLAKLKGKVVLVDFWATWCGPCIAELPNLRKVYAEYHDKGFEIIGITLENPGLGKNDSPERVAAKLEAAKAKMLEFAEKNGMPWPQYFDGKWWKNDYAVEFGVDAIPAMFLLDQQGQIASTEARGEKLESEVKRLLKL